MRNEIGARCSRIPLVLASLIALAGIVPFAAAQTPPLWNNPPSVPSTKCLSSPASIQCPGGAAIAPAAWPSDPQWVAYSWGTTYPDTTTADKHPIRDQRVQDPSNGGTTPQNYVNVSSGCPDQTLPSIYYFFNPATQIVYFRWRVEQIANNYATGPSAGSYSSSNPWNSALWTVFLDTNGDGFRDFAMHLDGSSGAPANPIDILRSIWSPLKSNSIDYVGDPTNIHSLFTNPTAFASSNGGSLMQFNGSGIPTTIQWPNGASETIWDYGTTRSINISTGSCNEYFVDYQIPLSMLNAAAAGGPTMTVNTPFQFLFATANSLNNPFQKDIVWDGNFVCDASSPGPFGDAVTLADGIIPQPISTSFSVGSANGCSTPVSAQIMDALTVANCQSISQLVSAQFKYYYDINGDGVDNDGGAWINIGNPTVPIGTTVTANWDTTNLIRGQYLLALEITDNRGHTTQTWMGKTLATLEQPFGTDVVNSVTRNLYTNVPPYAITFPYSGLSAQALGINYAKVTIAAPCGVVAPPIAKVASTNNAQQGAAMSYALTVPNSSATDIIVTSITDSLPIGFTYLSTPSVNTLGMIKVNNGGSGYTSAPTVNIAGGGGAGAVATATVASGVITGITVTSAGAGYTSAPTISFLGGGGAGATATAYVNTLATPAGVSGTSSVTWTMPANTLIPGGTTKTFVFNVTAGSSGGTFFNSGSFVTSVGTLTGTDTIGVTIRTASLLETKAVSLASDGTDTPVTVVSIGNTVKFKMIVTNNSQTDCTNVTVTDPLPPGFIYVSSSPAASSVTTVGSVTTVVWSGYTVTQNGGSLTFSVNAIANQAGAATNTATVTSNEASPVTASTNLLVNGPVLTIYKTANVSTVVPPGTVTYTVEYANVGNQAATLSYLGDTIPTGYTFTAAGSSANCIGTGVITVSVTNGGAGYVTAPSVTIGGGAGATATATISGGQVTAVTITNPGSGYASPTVTFNNAGTGFTSTAVATAVAGVACTSLGSLATNTTATRTLVFNVSAAAASPSTNTASINASNAATVTANYDELMGSNTCTSTTYNFRTTTATIGGSSHLLAQTTIGATNTTSPTFTVGNVFTEVIRFYQDLTAADTTTPYMLGPSATVITSWNVISGSPAKANYRVDLKIYDPSSNTESLVASATQNGTASFPDTLTITIPAGTVVKAGQRLIWVINAKDANGNGAQGLQLLYDGTANFQARSTLCRTPVSMSLSKSVDNLSISATGGTIAYTLKYSNPNLFAVPSVVITDPILAGLTFSSLGAPTCTGAGCAAGTATQAAGLVTWTLPASLPAGQTGTLVINATVNTATISGTLLTNTATLKDSYTPDLTASVSSTILSPKVLINKTVSATNFTPGVNCTAPCAFSYTVTAFNAGGVSATGVAVSDPLPAGIYYVSASPSPTTAPSVGTNGTVTWTGLTLASGATTTFTINAQIGTAGLAAGQHVLTNTASVIDNYNPTPRTSSASITVLANPLLTLSESETVSASRVVYISVTNGGSFTTPPTAANVTISGCSTPPTVAVSTNPVGGLSSGSYSITGISLITYGLGCTAPTISFTGGTGVPATATATLGQAPGDTITYLLTVTNTGSADAAGVVITGSVPANTAYFSTSTAGASFSGGQLISSPATCSPGTPTTLSYTVTVNSIVPQGVTSLGESGSATSTTTTVNSSPQTETNFTGATPRFAIIKSPDGNTVPFPLATANLANNTTSLSVSSTQFMAVGDYIAVTDGTSYYVAQITGLGPTSVVLSSPVSATANSNVMPVQQYTLNYSNVGTTGSGNLNVTDVLPATLRYGGLPRNSVAGFTIVSGGSGYTSAPTVSITGGGGSGATATASISGGSVVAVTIVTAGNDFTSVPTVNLSGGGGAGASVTAVLAHPLTATAPSPVGTSGTITWSVAGLSTGGSAAVDFLAFPTAAGAFTNLGYVDDGTGLNHYNAYDTASTTYGALVPTKSTTTPNVTSGTGVAHYVITVTNPLTSPAASGVSVTDNLPVGFTYKNGSTLINGVAGSDPCSSCAVPVWSGLSVPAANGTLTIAFDANVSANVPNGTYDNEIIVSSSNVHSLTFDYLATTAEDVHVCAPAPTITAPTACANSTGNIASVAVRAAATYNWSINNGAIITNSSTGTINSVTIGSGGSGYLVAPTITLSGGSGSGATATATISGGVITAITINNPGSGYTSASMPTVVITPVSGGASAAAVLGTGIIYTAGSSAETISVVITEGSCSVTASTTASVSGPVISVQPTDKTYCTSTTDLTLAVTASGATTFQWQQSSNGGATWANAPNAGLGAGNTGTGATTATYTYRAGVTPVPAYMFQVVLTGSGCSVTSNAITVTQSCTPDLQLTTNSDAPDPVFAGQNITYTQNITNVSASNATSLPIVMWQPIPTGTTFVSMTPPAGWACSNTSNGVTSINVTAGGTGYTNASTVTISGGGGAGATAVATVVGGAVTAITVTNPGSGYTSAPTVTISIGTGATTTSTRGNAETCTTSNIINSGATSGAFTFVVKVDSTAADGSTVTDTARVTTTNDPITSNNFNTTTTNVQRRVDAQTAKNDNALQTLYGRHFIYPGNPPTAQPLTWSITVANGGPSTASNMTITDAMPFGFTYTSSAITPSTNNNCSFASDTLTCTVASLDPTPVISFSGGTGGTSATATISGGAVTAIAVNTGGSGYTSAPQVYILGGGGSGATATATITGGAVTGFTITSGGKGYTSAPSISFSGGGGSPSAVATVSGGALASLLTNVPAITVTSGGSGYTTAPAVTISTAGSGSGATAGTVTLTSNAVSDIAVGSAGSGYTDTPFITVVGTTTVDSQQIANAAAITYQETDTYTANDPSSDTVSIVAPTVVKMVKTDATQSKNGVTISWSTSYEQDNLGFYVWRQLADGSKQKIDPHIIIGSALATGKHITDGRSYRVNDRNVPANAFVQYYVEDVDLKGVHTMHGPITPRVGTATPTSGGGTTDTDPTLGSVGGIFVTAPGMGVTPPAPVLPAASTRLAQQWAVSAMTAAKLLITQNGWYRIKKSDLVAAGFDPGNSAARISVFADGVEVPIAVPNGNFGANDTIEFYGTAIDTPSAGGHVYYVTASTGNNLRIQSPKASGGGSPAPPNYTYTFNRTERALFFSALIDDDSRDNFYGQLVWSYPTAQTLTVGNIDPSGGDTTFELALQGVTDNFNHVVSATLNGHDLGLIRYRGQAHSVSRITVPQAWLVAGDNLLVLTATGGDDDVSVIDYATLTYPHVYRAESNALAFTLPGSTSATVTGFTSSSIKVIDLSNPQAPLQLPVTVASATDGTNSVSFTVPDAGTHTLLAIGDDRVMAPAQIVLNTPSKLNATNNSADLVIITHKNFASAAATLKAARDAQGISTTIVDVQNVYDEFSYGAHGPAAIRAFLQRASTSWSKAPHYVILFGDASWDPRNYMGFANVDFLPTKLVTSQYLKTASDDWFADFNDTDTPVMAIGRLSVRTAEDAAIVVGKLVRRTAPPTDTWAKTVEIVTDAPGEVPFNIGGGQIAAAVPAGLTNDRIAIGSVNNPTDAIVNAFNRGSLLTNYIGHGSVEIWSDYVFDSGMAANLTNGDKLPFVVTMNCLNGYFHDMFTESLAEALQKSPNGGAIGVWASSALTSPDQQLLVNLELYRQIFAGSPSIGDAILKAKQATKDRDVRRTWILFGDPTMKLR
jgi:uncharacterized repeat protein (TIGR01451 family)/fimbrial isopeptide formation D2 family protein